MFILPDLQYSYGDLEPYIDAQTMELHHSKHHQTYVDKLNAATKDTEYADVQITELLQNLDNLPENIRTAVQNNGGGHYNHSFFWTVMSPKGGGTPQGELAEQIDKAFGNFQSFQEEFTNAAISRFGSGWAWLSYEKDSLVVSSSPNQDSPLNRGVVPILGLDVWEHAYYLKYQNKRPDYIDAWWSVVDWQQVANNLDSI